MARPTRTMMIGAAVVVVAALGGGVAYGVTSHSASTSPAPSAVPSPGTPAPAAAGLGKGHGKQAAGASAFGGLLARLQHGEFTAVDASGGTRTVDVQRGVITAVDASSVTLRSSDGYTATYAITPSTAITQPKGKRAAAEAPGQTPESGQPSPAGATGLRPNESVLVLADKTATGDTATRIVPVRDVA